MVSRAGDPVADCTWRAQHGRSLAVGRESVKQWEAGTGRGRAENLREEGRPAAALPCRPPGMRGYSPACKGRSRKFSASPSGEAFSRASIQRRRMGASTILAARAAMIDASPATTNTAFQLA